MKPRFVTPFWIASLLCLAGCTHTSIEEARRVGSYPSHTPAPVDLHVQLVLDDAVLNAENIKKSLGDTFNYRYGDFLRVNCEAVARAVFSQVDVSQNAQAPAKPGVQALLVPTPLFLEAASGSSAWSPAVATMRLEWQLLDPGGRRIWLETITGEGRGKVGNLFVAGKRMRERMDLMYESIFDQSYAAMSNAPEIAAFAREQP